MPEAPRSLAALVETGVALSRRTVSGRVLFGRLEGVMHADTLPGRMREPVRAELKDAHAATAVRLDAKVVERALKSAWGKAPGRVLDGELDAEPLAVTPTAQVHAGRLDGADVAVKVGRPGITSSVRNELALLDILAGPLGGVLPRLDAGAVLRELRDTALDELDLEHEGDQQQRVRRALRGVDGVVVPEVHPDLAGEAVLVTERLPGTTLDQGLTGDAGAIARRLVEAHVTAWREAGLVLTDSRASHVVQLDDGRTGLLGAGVARPSPRERAAGSVAAFAALGDADPDAFAEAVADELGILDAATAREAHAVLREVLGPLVDGPARLDGPELADVTRRAVGRIGELTRIAAKATPEPSDLAAARMLWQLAATLSRLGTTEDWTALAAAAAGAPR